MVESNRHEVSQRKPNKDSIAAARLITKHADPHRRRPSMRALCGDACLNANVK
jgi:hypothetical protein